VDDPSVHGLLCEPGRSGDHGYTRITQQDVRQALETVDDEGE